MDLKKNRRTHKKYLAVGVALIAALGFTSCGATNGSSGMGGDAEVNATDGLVIDGELIADAELYDVAKNQTLTLYTSYQESSETEFLKAFTNDTGIKVEMMRLVPAQLTERVLAETGAGKLPADIIRVSDHKLVQKMADADVWQNYIPEASKSLSPEIVVNDGEVVKALYPIFTFSYNTNLVSTEDAPTSWADLADTKWAGKISIIRGTGGGVMDTFNQFVESKLDPDYWDKVSALQPIIYEGGIQVVDAVAKGEAAVGHSGTANVNLMVTNDSAPLQYVIPEEGLVTFDYFLGLTKSSENIEAAKVFSEYNLSKRGQTVFSKVGDYSVRNDVEPPTSLGVKLPELDSGKVWRPSMADTEAELKARNQWAAAFTN